MKVLVRFSVAVLTLLAVAAPVSAATRVVDDDGEASSSNCSSGSDTPYTTISAALADAATGDKIVVCPGVYDEQLVIVVKVTITGKLDPGDPQTATVKPSPMAANTTSLASGNPIAAVILIETAGSGTVIDQLTVDAADNGFAACTPNIIGVYFRNASGVIKNSVVKNTMLADPLLLGCQVGLGIFAQSDGVGGTAVVSATGNSVHDYQKNGITGNEEGTTLTASDNDVSGIGATPSIAQNGIQLGFGAGGTVTDNRVNDHYYSLCNVITAPACAAGSSTGILLYQVATGTVASSNTVGTSQTGIYLEGDSAIFKGNTILNTIVYDGIAVFGNSNSLTNNSISDSDEAGIYIVGTSNLVQKNTINEAPVGVIADGSTIPVTGTGKNTFYNVGKQVDAPAMAATSTAPAVSPAR